MLESWLCVRASVSLAKVIAHVLCLARDLEPPKRLPQGWSMVMLVGRRLTLGFKDENLRGRRGLGRRLHPAVVKSVSQHI